MIVDTFLTFVQIRSAARSARESWPGTLSSTFPSPSRARCLRFLQTSPPPLPPRPLSPGFTRGVNKQSPWLRLITGSPGPAFGCLYCTSFFPPPVHRSGVNLCPNLIIHICQPASCNVLFLSLARLVGTRGEGRRGRGEKNKHPAPRKWGYITININGSSVSSNFQSPSSSFSSLSSSREWCDLERIECFDRRVYRTVFHEISRILSKWRRRRRISTRERISFEESLPHVIPIQLTLHQDLSKCTIVDFKPSIRIIGSIYQNLACCKSRGRDLPVHLTESGLKPSI